MGLKDIEGRYGIQNERSRKRGITGEESEEKLDEGNTKDIYVCIYIFVCVKKVYAYSPIN